MNIVKITPQMIAAGLAAFFKHYRLTSKDAIASVYVAMDAARGPIKMILHCPACGEQHVDAPDSDVATHPDGQGPEPLAWTNPPHRSHLCLNPECRHVWRPADVCTYGVREIETRGQCDDPRPTRAQ